MKLLTKTVEKQLKPYHGSASKLDEKVLAVKFFCPWSNWTWYAVEYSPTQGLFWGYVEGFENEWGPFSLEELESVTGPMGLKIERDLWWKPMTFKEYMEQRNG